MFVQFLILLALLSHVCMSVLIKAQAWLDVSICVFLIVSVRCDFCSFKPNTKNLITEERDRHTPYHWLSKDA